MKYIESLHTTGWEYGSVNIHHDTFFLGIFQLKGLNVNPSHDTIVCDAKDLKVIWWSYASPRLLFPTSVAS